MRDLHLFDEFRSKKCVVFSSLFSYTGSGTPTAGRVPGLVSRGEAASVVWLRSPARTPAAG